ncbi:MAG: hypothetical protein ACK4NY_02510 [Spirosomataceae bacterium]
MQLVYHIAENELDSSFLKSLKNAFKNKRLTIVVNAEEMDETEYLMSSPINKERLLNSIENIKSGMNLTEINLDELKSLVNA